MADMFGAAVDDMGHSGKAGENIFWAMNRNKPGIIKRILNALERFIARIRGKDAYLAVEQRQAAERLRDMLTGELKRAYGTDVKGGAAVESDGGKKYSIVYLDDGKTYVTASRNVISGNDVNQWRKQITNFFNALLEGNKSIDIETVEGDTLTITKKETARKARDNFKQENGKPVRMSDNEFRVKLNVEAHIDEIAETARSSKNTGSADTKSHAFAKDGFTYRTAYFEDFNGDYYRVRLSIGNNGTVATVYNVGKMIKDVPASAKILAVVGSKPLAVTSSDNSISQDSRNVNRQFSEISDAKTIEDGGTVENDSGEFVAESDGNGGTRWSLSTYESSGRETLRQYLDGQVSESGLTEADAKAVLDSMDDIYEICRKYEGEYVPFGAWSRAEVVIDEKGNPVFSVIKPNGEYAMNLDFSLVCKKRRALDAVLNRLIETGAINDFGFGQEEIVRVNEIIREHGFEIACDMCFVDAKRYRQAGVADQFVDLYNSIVKSMAKDGQEIDYFNFANDSSLSHTEGGIDRLSDAELDFSEINEITKPGAKKTVEYRVAQYLKTHPSDRKLLSRGDFMSTAGFDAVKVSKPDILKLYNSKKGTGGPKAAQSDVQYLNDILSSKKFNRSAAYDVGGVRVQSFSDYVPRLVFDYVQMIGDLAAKRLPAHAYTKEPLFAKQFGLTGMKINMSLMPAKGNGNYAGLNADGSYAWARESFPAEEAFRIQADPEYGKNVGTIAVGISDEHIWKMLSDPDIRMVIPYHKSGINPAVAVKLKIGEYTDYTGQQNTVRRDGRQLTKAELKNIPDINRLMHRDGLDAVEASRRYVEWCEDNGYIPKFEKFAYMTDSDGSRVFNENYYKLLEDFTTMVDGEFHPQGDVTATFPGSDSAFGSMADLIKEGLEEDAVTANRLNGEVDGLAEEVRSALGREESGKRFSLTRANGITTEITDDSYDEYEGGYQRRDIKLNGETVGTVAIRIYDDYSEIDRIDIDEKYRNKGIGTTVLGDIAGEFDTTYIVPDNESAKRLYERIGEEVTSGEVYENLDQGYGVYRLDKSYGNTRWSLAGTNEDKAEAAEFSDSGIRYSLRKEDPPKNTLTGYKVFVVKNGKLYPPMVANPDAADTPVGVWLNADIGAQAPDSKTGRKQVKAGGKGTQGGSGSLAFRPGWHLGETPLATQFDRTNPETGKRELFPENFVWAECEIAADKNYQEEAMSYGYTKSGKFQHSLAGLPKLPVDGYYKYRTNPNPDTVPWLITGAMKVTRLLGDAEVNRILESKGLPPKNRVGGNKTLADLGLEETAKRLNGDGNIRYSLSANAAEEIKKALADKNYSSEIKLTDTTPTIMLGHNGVKNLPLMMRATHLRENILTREQAKAKGLPTNPGINYHGLGEPLFLDVIADLDNVKEAYRGTQKSPNSDRRENYFLLISEKIDASGNTINIPVFINETAKYNNVFMDVNKAATVFGREQLRKYINRKLADGSLVRIKRRSIQSSEVSSPIEPHYRKNASSIDNSVSQNDPVVNTQSMQGIEKDSSDERHSLVKSAQSELKALQKENEKLRQDVDDLKQELLLTHGRKLSRDALISSIQKILIDRYGVKLPAKELYPHVTNLYDMFYNNTVDGKRLKKDERVDTMRIIEEMDKIVDAVIENAVGVDDTYVEMKKLLPELRNTKLVVPMDARADAAQSAGFENWAEFRKANFGRVGFANEGLPVDTYYFTATRAMIGSMARNS